MTVYSLTEVTGNTGCYGVFSSEEKQPPQQWRSSNHGNILMSKKPSVMDTTSTFIMVVLMANLAMVGALRFGSMNWTYIKTFGS